MRLLISALAIGLCACVENEKDRRIIEQAQIITDQAQRLENLARIVTADTIIEVPGTTTILPHPTSKDSLQVIFPEGTNPFGL